MTVSLPSWERGLKYRNSSERNKMYRVAPFVGAWIEIGYPIPGRALQTVAPFVGAWIEISLYLKKFSWHRKVAPFVGAWIEIYSIPVFRFLFPVAPFVGAWIEICVSDSAFAFKPSLPSWERGLK